MTVEAVGSATGGGATGASINEALFARASQLSWPAARMQRQGGWWLNFDPGAGSRATSVWPEERAPDLAAAVAAAEALYRAEGMAPRFQVWPSGPEGPALDALLQARGYRLYDRCTLMARAPGGEWPEPSGDCMVIEVRCPLARLDEIWSAGVMSPTRRAVLARAEGPKAVFLGRIGMRPAGAAGVVVAEGVAITQALHVDPHFRGKRLAGAMMAAIGRWAAGAGARVLAHAVVETNAPAIALYRRLGFQAFGGYHYRVLDREDRA